MKGDNLKEARTESRRYLRKKLTNVTKRKPIKIVIKQGENLRFSRL
jgi:hypothetical protein